MYGFGRKSGSNDDSFEDHHYLFSNPDGLLANTALLTPDPDPRSMKMPNSTFNSFDDLSHFDHQHDSEIKVMPFTHETATTLDSEDVNFVSDHNSYSGPSRQVQHAKSQPLLEHRSNDSIRADWFAKTDGLRVNNIHTSVEDSATERNGNRKHQTGLHINNIGTYNHGLKLSGVLGTPDSSKPYTDTTNSERRKPKPSFVDVKLDFKARSSIPPRLSWMEYGRQGILAAYSSRLNPYALHPKEYELLRPYITRKQVTIYLNIRNGILRLWHRNPLVAVTKQEAAGCTRDSRHFALSQVAHEWLLRNGYINFGCISIPSASLSTPTQRLKSRQKKIVVIGAGVSGLGCARQLEALLSQFENRFTSTNQKRPSIVILEGRNRIGGRVFSHPLIGQNGSNLPEGMRCTAEMGAQIVTGFENGNPLNFIVRGQLALRYHTLRDNSVLFDSDGQLVDKESDLRLESLWNDILERAAVFRNKLPTVKTVEGDKSLLMYGEDPKEHPGDDQEALSALEDSGISITIHDGNPVSMNADLPQSSAMGVEKLAGRQYHHAKASANSPAAQVAKSLGWSLKPSVSSDQSIDLRVVAESSQFPTLGNAMDEGIQQYQQFIHLSEQDLRLLNWHHANLEYANAVNVNHLSLGGWDQDIGNEFEGEHTEIIGGYTQVPRGLWRLPTPLDVRFRHTVQNVSWGGEISKRSSPAVITCTNGQTFEADYVILTAPLGVLKSGSISFQPALPDWKTSCIDRMGFGLLNKIVLVYDNCFWEEDRDMFGLLNDPVANGADPFGSILDQSQYSFCRGRFYLFWNCIKTSGKPVLIALMAGSAAHQAEQESNDRLVEEVTGRLAKIFAPKRIPHPSEVIITRWKRDPFARGSYSYVGANTQPGDYDVMAQPCGPIHFAGEATCGTHPATVHGAYISGLRAAADVTESLLGPIHIESSPLIRPKVKQEATPTHSGPKRKFGYVDVWEPIDKPDPFVASLAKERELDEYDARVHQAIVTAIGERPPKPAKGRLNPFIMYTKDRWSDCKAECDAQKEKATGNPNAKATRQEIRAALGTEWRNAPEHVKQPYLDKCKDGRENTTEAVGAWEAAVRAWDNGAVAIRAEYTKANQPPEAYNSSRKGRRMTS